MIKNKLAALMDAFASRVASAQINQSTHPLNILRHRAAVEAADFIQEHGPEAALFRNQMELIDFALPQAPSEGLFLEFGVNRGASIRRIAGHVNGTVHGFDSFEGLPSDGAGTSWRKAQFDRDGKLPDVPDNVVLHKGWFDATLPEFLKANDGGVSFVHIDCDLYESAAYVLESLASRISPGTMLLFDEWFNFPGWEQHESRAFNEFKERYGVRYQHVGFARQQTAIVVETIG
jgi:hypothetical protein